MEFLMSKRMLIALALLSLCTGALAAELEGSFTATIKPRATGHSFGGAVTSETFKVVLGERDAQTLATFTATAKMAKLTTFKKKRDQEMLDHFNAAEHPDITGKVTGFPLETLAAATEEKPVMLPFELGFAGGEVKMEAAVTSYTKAADGQIEFDTAFTVSQKACGCEPISMALVMSVKDEVPVRAHFTLKPKKP
jgi:polyisoprenoid-binding protein YceI